MIHRRDQGETDRVLRLCTPLGKLDVIVKGARRIRSRKAGHIELFSRSNFLVARSRNSWDIVSQAETLDSHETLRTDLLRGAYARYAVELLDRFFADGEGGPALVDLLDRTLESLTKTSDLDLVIRFYELHLLQLAGFRPELARCVRCQRAIPVAGNHRELASDSSLTGFDHHAGGVLCQDCYRRPEARRGSSALSSGALSLLVCCQSRSIRKLMQYTVPDRVRREAELTMRGYIRYHLEHPVRSAIFLDRLRREVPGRAAVPPAIPDS